MSDKVKTTILNFVGGEISPSCAARADLELLAKSLARAENFVILPQGGASKRAGSYNLGLTKNNNPAYLIPFQFSANDALMIVATDSVFRFYRNDAVVLNTAFNIAGADQANPCKIYVGNHNFTNGQEVFISGVSGMSQLNGRFFLVANSTTAPKTITAISKANPGVFTTSVAHGFVVGQRVNIVSAAGGDFTQVNGDWIINSTPLTTTFTVKNVAGTPLNTTAYAGAYTASSGKADAGTITLQDAWGAAIDSTTYSAWVSGGSIASVYELTTPYQAQDLAYIRTAQTADVMYLACRNDVLGSSYQPYKLVRNGFTDWTLNTFVRKSDPFPSLGILSLTPTAITKAVACRVTVSSTAGLNNGDVIYAQKIGGMKELIGNFYLVANKTATTFTLQDPDGNAVDSTLYTTFTTGGTFTRPTRDPGCVGFSADGRLVFAATAQNPEGYWGSRTPQKFLTRYDDFSLQGGTSASDPTYGMAFSFSPVDNKIDTIREVKQFGSNFALLGASSIRQIYGAQQGQPPTPIAINTMPTLQGAARVPPLVINWNLLFVDVNQARLRGLQFNLAYNTFQANDYNLTSEHLGLESPFIRLAYTKGTPDQVFCLRQDGVLLAFSFNNTENIAGWSRLYAGGNGVVEDIATIRKSDGVDELYLIVKRTANGKTYRSVEVMDVWPTIPTRESYYGGVSEKTDEANWQNAAWEAVKESTYLDSSLTFDGTVRGINANANITPSGSAAGAAITITASASVFQPSDVGSQIWKNYAVDGSGGGRAQITGYTSATQVSATVISAFDNASLISAGNWTFAVSSLNNAFVYEGITVGVQADGGGQPSQTVTGGKITLANNLFASKIQIGYPYSMRLLTQNIDWSYGSQPRVIKKIKARLLNSTGGKIGTSEYNASTIVFNRASQNNDRIPAPFTGVLDLPQLDNWQTETKRVAVLHSDPTPFTLLSLEVEGYVSETP